MASRKVGNGVDAMDEHIGDQIAVLEETLARVDEVFGSLSSVDYYDITKNLTSLEKARYDLTNLYAINSLFWMYVRSYGEDPKNTSVKEELERIRRQMLRLSQIANKHKTPRINKEAAARFIKNSLPKSTGRKTTLNDENWEEEPMETDSKKQGIKRKLHPETVTSAEERDQSVSTSSSDEEGEVESSSEDTSE